MAGMSGEEWSLGRPNACSGNYILPCKVFPKLHCGEHSTSLSFQGHWCLLWFSNPEADSTCICPEHSRPQWPIITYIEIIFRSVLTNLLHWNILVAPSHWEAGGVEMIQNKTSAKNQLPFGSRRMPVVSSVSTNMLEMTDTVWDSVLPVKLLSLLGLQTSEQLNGLFWIYVGKPCWNPLGKMLLNQSDSAPHDNYFSKK